MAHRLIRQLALLAASTVISLASHAQLAQEPLLNRPNTVSPNLVLILDSSGSMDATYIYQYGNIDSSGMGMQGPNCSGDPNRPSMSPDINMLHYDPRVRYFPRKNYQGTDMTLSSSDLIDDWRVYFRKTTGSYTNGQLCDLNNYHNPYAPPDSLLVLGGSGKTYEINNDSSGGNNRSNHQFPKFINRADCTANTTWCTYTEERRNFSIWKKWYSTRARMTQTGIGLAFNDITPDSVRLGYSHIRQLNGSSVLARGVSTYNSAAGGTKDSFYTWLYGLDFDSGTPNLVAVDRVGKYFSRTDSDGPWATVPNPASTGISTVSSPSGPGKNEAITSHAGCRRSFSMLITDGFWNGDVPTTAGNADNTAFTIMPRPSGEAFVYKPEGPYSDGASNTLADIAMHYWGRDLRTDLSDRVPRIDTGSISNPSIWQNMSFYAVTLGLDGTLPRTTTTLAELTAGRTLWPSPTANSASTMDDTWHATINGRGEMIKANNANDLTNALNRMFTSIAGTPQTLSGVAVSTTFLKNGTRKYKPEYIPGTWSGRLSAIELDEETGNDKSPSRVFWQVESGPAVNGEPVSLIPAPASRNIATWSGSVGTVFNAANTGLDADLVNYVRGDPSKELRKTGGVYRSRDAKLGDIINSSPVFILDNLDLSYEKLTPAGSFGDYRRFYNEKKARAGVLFVGANDGMLHAFPDSNGVESFAYIPKAVIPKLEKLADVPYVHQYYVDGPNVETDAYLEGNWRNVLLGTTGAGAKAVYALDVTAPLEMTPSKIMWEINTTTTGFAQLGHVLSDVQAGITENGDWVAIFGNGYGSSDGIARLYVVNLQTGALLKTLSTNVGGTNGLGGVRIVRNAAQRIIGAYAGDLKGNMWKFDLTGSVANWKVALSASPLYAAGTTKPITATPAVLPHPNGGNVVTFGTGKFFEEADKATTSAQTMYGIWDSLPFGTTSVPAFSTLTGTTSLVQQTITTVPVGTPTVNFFRVSSNPVNWGNGFTGTRGWYMHLPNSGQRVVYPVERMAGTFILASTLSPESSTPADLCVQSGSGSGWVYLIDGITGSGTTKPTLDTNKDGKVDGDDAQVSGFLDPVDGRPTSIIIESTRERERICIETAQTSCTRIDIQCGQIGAGACPITAVPGVKSREWRQLFMR
ncbi:PilC/PilY family type IV pilus protein [uncultured Ramlibacter sp.]|uniref:pilus assembly protein n=1 Tax=uncultured Ramlibacter sp. TaxID=260755 RepID=UPI002608740F|nr:PilC/PilY family type IV pilus protein [uncultured Ramlibacter sp.]